MNQWPERASNSAGSVRGTLIQTGAVYGDVTVTAAGGDRRPLRSLAELPLTTEYDPLLAGVHRVRRGRDGSGLPPYVARDADGELRDRIRDAADRGGVVLVVGPSTAGKSRTALEAVRRVLPGHRLLAPDPGSDLRRLVELDNAGAVSWLLWLDDLENHLGPQALGPELLEWLRERRVPVVATMRARFYRELRDRRDRRPELRAGMLVLNTARVLTLHREWSPGELARVSAAAHRDDRLREAHARHGDFGVAEYLAAGPELLEEWQSARAATADGGHPRGHALVAAAVDLARVGLTAPVPRELLDRLHTGYLAGAALLRPEGHDEAWRWATEQRSGAAGLLVPGDVAQTTWRAFDYLVDSDAAAAVPGPVWLAALERAAEDDRWRIGRAALDAGEWSVAETAWRPLAERGDQRAMNDLAFLLERLGRDGEAADWYARAAEAESAAAMYALGMRLKPRRGLWADPLRPPGRWDLYRAGYWFRRAAEQGHVAAMYELALLSSDAFGGSAEKRTWLLRAAEAGHAEAMRRLAGLTEPEDPGQASEWLRRAVAAGSLDAGYDLALLSERRGDPGGAEEWLRRAAEAGHRPAAYRLAALLDRRGADDAARWLARAVCRDLGGVGGIVARSASRVEEEPVDGAVDAGTAGPLPGGSLFGSRGT
ncbi:tetratricopeptide repeat protein [Thermobifida cellulosilytica]|uniref:tetratricopeptide repeat protein n=1 Tax=Thermobifida cellulosilytica TaxID=144786 RepID=UPI000837B998|nr:tetratricopeptide repeat protein [Thermobifida cellulosilytica]